MNNKKKYLDLNALKIYHSKLKSVIESKANSSDVYNKTDVYNRSEVDAALDSKSDVGHTHDQYVTEQNVYTKEQVDTALNTKANSSDVYTSTTIDAKLNLKADSSDVYTTSQVDTKLSSKSNIDHTHGNITKDGLLATADQVVVTDSNKKIASIAKGTAFNKNFGTTAGTVSEGNHTHDDVYIKGPSSATNNNIAIFDRETGKLIKTSTASIDHETLSILTRLSFRNRENPSIEMMSSGKSFYLQSFQGKICLGSTLNTSTYWDADGVARFQAVPNVKGTNVSLEGHTHTASEITDFPTIPTVNNATLTIQKNGSNVATFTANSSTNTTANITVPTKVSELSNDSGFIKNTGPSENGETKLYNRYAQKGYTGGGSTYWYYKIATLPQDNAGNYASLIITGRIGGWEAGNMSSVNALIFNRGGDGIVAIDLAKTSSASAYNLCDIVCYRESDNKTSVYLKCAGYFTFDINVESYQSGIVLPTSVSHTTSVTGTEKAKLSTSSSRLEIYNGNAYVGGTKLAKSSDIPTRVGQLDNDSGYTNNTGTVTSVAVKMNGATKGTVTSSGTIDLGTVITSHQDISGKADKATTLSGYGITNAYTKTETNNLINSIAKTVVFDTYDKFIQFLEDTSQATYDYFNVGDSIYIKEEGSDYWISGKEDIVEGGYSYNRIISGRTGSDLLGTDNIYRKTVTVNIGTTYTSVEPYEVKPQSEAGYSNFSWNSSTGDVKITLESLRPNTEVTVTLKTYTPASGGGDYGYYNISNIGPTKVSELTNDSGYLTTLAAANKYLPLSGGTLTGNLTGKYITGTWLQTTAASDLGSAPPKYGVISENGWLYTRTLEETKSDLGINSKSPIGHSHGSILDYGDTNKTIKIGYSGAGLTASQVNYIAGYTAGDNANEHKIKDISKDVLKTWLGYTEVTTGTIRNNSLNIADGTYLWIVYPTSGSTTSFSFTSDNSTYTAYHFAIIQSGHPGSVRYFTNPTTLAIVKTTSIGFSGRSGEVHYIKFKIE